MRYRTRGLWISCLCQVWEQQLIDFVDREMDKNGYDLKDLKFSNVKECFKEHNQNFETMTSWMKIQELRWLVNVLKHGEGNFARRLRKIRPEIFIWSNSLFTIDRLDIYKSSLLKRELTDFLRRLSSLL